MKSTALENTWAFFKSAMVFETVMQALREWIISDVDLPGLPLPKSMLFGIP